MSSAAITTIVKMVESLPDNLQERVADRIREYIADLEDEVKWESSFERTRPKLVAAARQAKQEIAAGKSVPMDYDSLWSLRLYRHFGKSTENWVNRWKKGHGRIIACGLKIRFTHRYISSASIAMREFGRCE